MVKRKKGKRPKRKRSKSRKRREDLYLQGSPTRKER